MTRSLVDTTLRIRGGALIVSIAFHFAIFYAFSQMEVPSPRPFVGESVESPLRIQVELIAPRTISDIPPLPVDEPAPAPAVESSEIPVDIIEASPEAVAVALPITSETATASHEADALAVPVILETTDSLLSSDDTKTSEAGADSWITPDTGPQAGAFGNVFDPRLRQRLQHNHTHRSTARSDGPVETRNAYGDRRVALDNERCMRARQSMRSGETTDWYLTSCGGLDEGEKMLRRVEQNWRKRGE